jgi:hypothetical protein
MTQTDLDTAQPTTMDCIFENILVFMLPFFLSSAGGDADLASDTIRELAEGYNVTTATELELAGRILGFSTVAMDNLRLSMDPEMADTKVLRYRSNAVALSRAAEQCRTILDVMQANRTAMRPPVPAATIPAPAIAAAPPPAAKGQPPQSPPKEPGAQPSTPKAPTSPSPTGGVSLLPHDLETMKREARMVLAAFSNRVAPLPQSAASFPAIPDAATLVGAAVRQALAAGKPPTAT